VALAIIEVLGATLRTLTSVSNLAAVYVKQGRYDEAELLYVENLRKMEVALNENHPDILGTIDNLAGLYVIQGRYEEAEHLYVECLQKSKKVLGENHPLIVATINNLTTLYESQGG
jgi:Flp pilus assembly protein TadD